MSDIMGSKPLKQISASTNENLSMVTDPYHDRNMRVRGYPDGKVLVSAVQRYQGLRSLANPFTLTAGQTWSFHIFTTPFHFSTPVTNCNFSGNQINFAPGGIVTTTYVGPLMVQYLHHSNTGAIINQAYDILGQDVSNNDPDCSHRTVSLAFELHNTTAEIQRAGALTCYRTNAVNSALNFIIPQPGGTNTPWSSTLIASLPGNTDEAELLPNTRTWEADAGAYLIALPHVENDPSFALPKNILLRLPFPIPSYASTQTGVINTSHIPASWSPLSCVGCISSRYSGEQTFTLDYRRPIVTGKQIGRAHV